MRVAHAGQQVDAGRVRSAPFAAVAALCCCTSVATLTIQCQPHWDGWPRPGPSPAFDTNELCVWVRDPTREDREVVGGGYLRLVLVFEIIPLKCQLTDGC